MPKTSENNVLDELRQDPTNKVKVAITDIDGVLRGKYLHKDKFFGATEGGFGFCNVIFGWDANDVCYDNVSFTGWHTGYPDALARPDLSTFRRVPWDNHVPFFLADFEDAQGAPLAICPRKLLRQVIERTKAAGFEAKTGMEFEWFNFIETPQSWKDKHFTNPQPITPGMFGYSLLRTSRNLPFFNALMDEMQAFRIPIEGLHTETGPGVLEAAILYSDALESADRAALFKTGAKEIAARFGIMPTFMAKWNTKLPGSSGHLHQSLWSAGKNAFYDAQAPHTMSATYQSYLAGILKCLPEILPMFAPTVNSYKRLVDGYWAPTRVSWGVDNRTVACRVIPGSEKSTRLELRVPGADVNPYLSIAAALAAGLYGIQNQLPLTLPPLTGSAYMAEHAERLPRTLQEATARMRDSKIARELFGAAFVDHFVATRDWEWRQAQEAVTSWELERYFEIV
ncbi:MAG: glutamine synthetase family protein [Deltaproteobacteria bacterium]|nr:glutamine synthetase family protein [Deltaproteobacteria bacterium]